MTTPAETTLTQAWGEAKRVQISHLMLDPFNPRLPADLQGHDQEDLAVDMALGFDAYTVAESIASHGFFTNEPLIAIPADKAGLEGESRLVVVEGNRRLTALLGLAKTEIRNQFADAERWAELAKKASVTMDDTVPVVMAPDRRSVTPIIGFRHISGILQWQPYAQARYIAKLVDDDGMDFQEAAEMIGISRTKVANLYRDQAIAEQAKSMGFETGNLERSFSLLTVAMNQTKIRNHVGAPLGSKTQPGEPPIPSEDQGDLKEVLGWVFGSGVTKPVISDSREIAKLGNVVSSAVGLQALRDGESLEQAVQKVKDAGIDPRRRLLNRLRAGKNAVLAASEDISELEPEDEEEVVGLVDEIESAVEALRSGLPGA